MAVIKISELPNMGTVANNDILPIVDVSETETKKITKENLLTDIPAGELDLTNVTETTQINDADYLLISQGGTTKKIKKENTQFASGDEVVVSTTEPSDPDNELKLWVNPDEVISPSSGLRPYVLYETSSGHGTTGNVQLNDDIYNYEYIGIYCCVDTNLGTGPSNIVDLPIQYHDVGGGISIMLNCNYVEISNVKFFTNLYYYSTQYGSADSLNVYSSYAYDLVNNSYVSTNHIYISKIVGYK